MSIAEDILSIGTVSTPTLGLYQCICIYTSDICWEEELQYTVCSKTYPCMCNESDLEHFSFVVNIVVNVFVETVPRKYSCVLLDWKIQTLCHVYARVW